MSKVLYSFERAEWGKRPVTPVNACPRGYDEPGEGLLAWR